MPTCYFFIPNQPGKASNVLFKKLSTPVDGSWIFSTPPPRNLGTCDHQRVQTEFNNIHATCPKFSGVLRAAYKIKCWVMFTQSALNI